MPQTLLHGLLLAMALAAPPDAELTARLHVSDAGHAFGLSHAEVRELRVARRYVTRATGMTTLWLQQTLDGLPVDGAVIRFAIDRSGAVVWSRADRLAPGVVASSHRAFGPAEALARAASDVGLDPGGAVAIATPLAGTSMRLVAPNLDPPALVTPVTLRNGHPGWRIHLQQTSPMDAWSVLVDAATGRVAARERLVFEVDDGLVFDGEYPDTEPGGVPQEVRSFGPTPASPDGWLFDSLHPLAQFSTGNNADAREDWVGDNELTAGARADGGTAREFRFPLLDAWASAGDYAADLDGAITNAFFWTNRWHDLTYALGFDEAAGNCQSVNFGLGGAEGDPVGVDVHDGATLARRNNANMTTPPDGIPPRMQLSLFQLGSGASLRRTDSAFDGDVILHELTHTLSTRLVGGAESSCLTSFEAAALGEGLSDFFAMSYFDDPVVGEYTSGDFAGGFRGHSAEDETRTYCDLCRPDVCQVHRDGFILAAAMWDLRALVAPGVATQLMVDALKLVPCDPSWVDLRDGLLAADTVRHGGAYACLIWEAFRGRGMGLLAVAGGGDGCDLEFVSPACSSEPLLAVAGWAHDDSAGGDGDGLVDAGEIVDLEVSLVNDGVSTATAVSATVTSLTPGITLVTGDATWADLAPGASAPGLLPFRFEAGPGYVCGSAIEFSIRHGWEAPARSRSQRIVLTGSSTDGPALLADDFEGAAPVWRLDGPAATSTAENHTPAGTQSVYMSAACWAGNETECVGSSACNDTCATLTTAEPMVLPSAHAVALRFWTRYNLEEGWDGLIVQVSADAGATWTATPVEAGAAIAAQFGGCLLADDAIGVTGPPGNAGLSPWTAVGANLAPWAGRDVMVRIVQHHDGCIHYEGAYIDDIGLVIQHCETAPFVALHALRRTLDDTVDGSCSDGDGIPDPDETVEIATRVINIGSALATGAEATLEATSPNVLGLPATVVLGDLAPIVDEAPATFRFSVASIPATTCFEDAGLSLRLTSTRPSADIIPVPARLRGDATATTWNDDFEGVPPWVASLGPDGTDQDWALRELDCLTATGRRYFWSVNVSMVPPICSTGEPDYSDDSDSVLTSPRIDLGAAGATLLDLSWASAGLSSSVAAGFAQVLVDHDGDDVFTPVWTGTGGFGAGSDRTVIDLVEPPERIPFPPAETVRFVRVQLRFRAFAPDFGASPESAGWSFDDFEFRWFGCPDAGCSFCEPPPGFAGVRDVIDRSACMRDGVAVGWDPAVFGPSGGTYEVWRDGVRVAAAVTGTSLVDLPGDDREHDYRVFAVSADCLVEDGNVRWGLGSDSGDGLPAPLGNVLVATRSADAVHLRWMNHPSAEGYEVARSEAPDFALPRTTVGAPTSGDPGIEDAGAARLPGLHTYRVAQRQCGSLSEF